MAAFARHRAGRRRCRFVGKRERSRDERRRVVGGKIVGGRVFDEVMALGCGEPGLGLLQKRIVALQRKERERGADHVGVVGRDAGIDERPIERGMREAVALRHRFRYETEGLERGLLALSTLPLTRAACARPVIASPFQSARTLSSRPG